MQFRRKHKEGAEVFTDSLNDIMFFLLLFFLIVSTLANPNVIKIEPPSSKQTSTLVGKNVTLQMDAAHNYYVNNVQVTFDQLEPALIAETKAKGTNSVTLILDKTLTVQDLADVMQVGGKLGLKMVLSAKPAK